MKAHLPAALVGAAIVAWGHFANAQEASPTPLVEARLPSWRAEMPGGTYTVALRAIVSVSKHEYVVDNAARVTEFNIDTTGTTTVRFYHLEPNIPKSPVGAGQSLIDKARDLTDQAAARSGQDDAWQRVVKSYPATTHAHTVEYRLSSLESLDKLFASADRAFRLQRPDTVTIK